MSTTQESQSSSPYALPSAAGDQTELNRLDAMHKGLNAFLDNKLSFAPIENLRAKSILEVGSGGGAWAIQAAEQYPEAQVLAADINPLPPRPLPPNLSFMKLNLLDPTWPMQDESFDVIHVRFVFIHLPNFQDVLGRLIPLLKPGGYFLIEDYDLRYYDNKGPSPRIAKYLDIWHKHMSERGVDPDTTRKIEPFLDRTGAFSEISVTRVPAPLSPNSSDDPNLRLVGDTMRISTIRAFRNTLNSMGRSGMTEDIIEGYCQDIEDPTHAIKADIYVIWARKSS